MCDPPSTQQPTTRISRQWIVLVFARLRSTSKEKGGSHSVKEAPLDFPHACVLRLALLSRSRQAIGCATSDRKASKKNRHGAQAGQSKA